MYVTMQFGKKHLIKSNIFNTYTQEIVYSTVEFSFTTYHVREKRYHAIEKNIAIFGNYS